MKIVEIRIYPFVIPLAEPFVISLGTITHARNLLIELHTDSGITGLGECSPYPFINGEMLDGQIPIAEKLGTLWLGKNPQEIENRLLELDRALSGNMALKSAFDMALYDLNAKLSGMPLYAYLGGANDKVVYTDRTVSVGEPTQMALEARNYLDAGFHSIKIKLGGPYELDMKRIEAIRAAVGYDIPLRLDANQAWTVAQAVRTLRALEKFNIEHCEEPIHAGDLRGLNFVRKISPIPIMADESLFDHKDAIRLVQNDACDYFNIKLSKSGGLFKALKIVAIAEGSGIACQVGCFSESRLGITALMHLVLARKAIVHYDMDSPLMLKDDPLIGGVEISAAGKVSLQNEIAGIGVSVDYDYLGKAVILSHL
ncbi:MAG: dipeptide epimerase [Saprospirales bacterium]|nr:MAG: dipeptide epimerase [Saprospirales bacterium]